MPWWGWWGGGGGGGGGLVFHDSRDSVVFRKKEVQMHVSPIPPGVPECPQKWRGRGRSKQFYVKKTTFL